MLKFKISSTFPQANALPSKQSQAKATIDFGKSANITDWRWDNWGTRTDAYVLNDPDEWQNKDETINLINSFGEFITAWSPPIKVIEKLQKMFPDYTFALDYIDEQFMFCGCLDTKGNDDHSEEEKDLRYYGSYLLNYSHKDLDEFFESCEENV